MDERLLILQFDNGESRDRRTLLHPLSRTYIGHVTQNFPGNHSTNNGALMDRVQSRLLM